MVFPGFFFTEHTLVLHCKWPFWLLTRVVIHSDRKNVSYLIVHDDIGDHPISQCTSEKLQAWTNESLKKNEVDNHFFPKEILFCLLSYWKWNLSKSKRCPYKAGVFDWHVVLDEKTSLKRQTSYNINKVYMCTLLIL